MNGFNRRTLVFLLAGGAVLGSVVVSVAELAEVYLKNGLKLRGDVTTVGDEVVLRNAAGELRLPVADVERVVPVRPTSAPAATQPATAPSRPTPAGGDAAPASEPTADRGAPAEEPEPEALPPAPVLSERDIQRLKMLELTLDGPAEVVRVRFKRKGRRADLPEQVLEELRRRPDFEPEWEQVLRRGRAYEKLQLILRETGMKYADRIEIQSDPEVFARYRRRMLPLINRTCGRSGCHFGKTARAFRFPLGSMSSDAHAYTTFVLLDQMETRHGPLIDRTVPNESVLLGYMLPQEQNEQPHPEVGRGPPFKPALRSAEDELYTEVLDWLNYLIVPPPDYGLEYENPYGERVLVEPAAAAVGPEPTSQAAEPEAEDEE